MGKYIAVFFTIICIIGLLTSCGKNHDETIEFSFDDNGNYTGFSNLPMNYTVEDAKEDEYYVKQDSKDIANRELWDNFIKDALKGKNTSIRIVNFYTETEDDITVYYFSDLFFNDSYYYLFDSSSENQEKQSYKYLLMLEGKFGNPLRDSWVVVLTNDNTLTFNDVMKSLVSSNMEYIKSVPTYRLVMFE